MKEKEMRRSLIGVAPTQNQLHADDVNQRRQRMRISFNHAFRFGASIYIYI